MFSFDKSKRLVKKHEFDHVFLKAKKITTKEFTLLYRKNHLAHARLGLALSKKAISKAHDRNRIKRLIREQFRMTTLPAVDLVFLARSGVAEKNNQEINFTLGGLWKKLVL